MRVVRPENVDKRGHLEPVDVKALDDAGKAALMAKMAEAGLSKMARQEVLSGAMLLLSDKPEPKAKPAPKPEPKPND